MTLMDSHNSPFQRYAFSIAETSVLTGLSTSTIYRRIGDGTLRTVLVGRRRLVPDEAARALCGCKHETEDARAA
jgi:excisionase family DNA binding protein